MGTTGLGTNSPPIVDRVVFGFLGWKTESTDISMWVYAFGNLLNFAFTQDSGIAGGYVFPTENYSKEGPVPTIYWEAVREGVKDLKYLKTLERLIKEAEKKQVASAEVAKAKEVLKNMKDQIKESPRSYDVMEGSKANTLAPAAYDKWRWNIAELIIKIQEKMK